MGLVVVRGNASEHAHACAAKALAQAGLTRVVPVEVAYSSMLVGAAQVSAFVPVCLSVCFSVCLCHL